MKFLFLLFLPLSMLAQNIPTNLQGSGQAASFVNSLSDTQKNKAVFPFEEMNRYDWHYVPATMIVRRGIAIKDLESSQKQNLYALMQVFLSVAGYERTKNIMDNEYLLKEMEPDNVNRIPENYFVAVYGDPGKESIWGWRFTGHHVTLNFTIVDGKLAFAPFFFGIYPAEIKEGKKKGLRIMKEEEDQGFALVNSLSEEQMKKALFQQKAFTDIVTTNSTEVAPLQPVGILAGDMKTEQRIALNKLIVTYLLSMPTEIAKARMGKITAEDFNSIHFGWAGETEPGKPHYYRIQGKSFLIEFDNTQNHANHIHAVWRDFTGDFGTDLIREHYHVQRHHQ